MPTIAHKLMKDTDMHRFVRWEVADLAARDALVVTVDDVHKVAYVTSVGQYFSLTVASPMSWKLLSYTSTNPVVNVSVVGGDLVFTYEDATTATVGLPEDPVAVVGTSYDGVENVLTLTYSDGTFDTIDMPNPYTGNALENVTVDDSTDELVLSFRDNSTARRTLPAVYAGNAVESITKDLTTNELVVTFRDTTTARVALPPGTPIGRALLEGTAVDATGKLALDGALYTVAAYPALAAALGVPAFTTVSTTRTAGLPAGFTNFPEHLTAVIRADDGVSPRWVAVSDSGTRISVINDSNVVQWTDNNLYPNSQIIGYHAGFVYIATRGRNGTDFGVARADPLVANSVEWFPGSTGVSPLIYKEKTAYWNGYLYVTDESNNIAKIPLPNWTDPAATTGGSNPCVGDDNYVWLFTAFSPYVSLYEINPLDSTDLQLVNGIDWFASGKTPYDALPCEDVARHYWQDADWLVTFALTANKVFVMDKNLFTRDTAKEAALSAITTGRTVGAGAVIRGYGNGQGFIMTTGVDDTVYIVDIQNGWTVTEADLGASTIPDLAIIEGVAAVVPVGTDASATNGYLSILPAATDFNVPNVVSSDPQLEWRIQAE